MSAAAIAAGYCRDPAARRRRRGSDLHGFAAPASSTGFRYRVACVCALLFGVWQFAGAVYIHAKADVAQVLLERAWTRTLATGTADKPWPWADTAAVARLRVPRLDIEQIVLSGDSGRTLAFGPGWAEASAVPGSIGNSVISGHRDTHFAFLKEIRTGDRIELETADGRWGYRVTGTTVVNGREGGVQTDTDRSLLTLVTCYPFDAIVPGGPLRFVVSAERVASDKD